MEVKALLHSAWHFLNLWLLKTSARGAGRCNTSTSQTQPEMGMGILAIFPIKTIPNYFLVNCLALDDLLPS